MAGKHDQIAGVLIQDILSGRYRVTERLPSERDLAARFCSNRGAVREAMTKLEQIGLVDIQPGGARVKDKDDASPDIISHLLNRDKLPEATLIDQIMVVINTLISLAAEQSLELATDEELDRIRSLLQPLIAGELNDEEHTLARFELMHSMMQASRNLPLRIIARTLFDQVEPSIRELKSYSRVDADAYGVFAKQLDQAIEERDACTLKAAFSAVSNLNRESMMRALESARANQGPEAKVP